MKEMPIRSFTEIVEYRNLLKKEIERIIYANHDNSLYSASDLIKLKEEEEKKLNALYEKILNQEKNIKSIKMHLLNSKLDITLYLKQRLMTKKLMIESDAKKNIINQPVAFSFLDETKVIWDYDKAKKCVDRYKNIIDEIIDFGFDNLTDREEIKDLNSKYFALCHNELIYYMYLLSTNGEFLYTRRLDKNNNYEDEFKNSLYFDEYIQRFKQNKNHELERFLNNIQFNEKAISNNLNKHLIKIKK